MKALGEDWAVREIANLRMRYCGVDRFNPSRAAAPLGPLRTHPVSSSTSRICLRLTSSSVSCLAGLASLPVPVSPQTSTVESVGATTTLEHGAGANFVAS